MTNHIILSAFGTTTAAKQAYSSLEDSLQPQFPGYRIHWFYTSPTVRLRTAKDQPGQPDSLQELLTGIISTGPGRIVIQSLHVLPGHEFHRLARQTGGLDYKLGLGMPLLHCPADYSRVRHCLGPLLDRARRRHQAVLVLGHGTDHPCWTAFCALEAELRKEGDPSIFVATLEKYPGAADRVIAEIRQSGHREVLVIPFLMVAGMHFVRDIVGQGLESVQSRLTRNHLLLHLHEQGLATLPGIAEIFGDHIKIAFDSIATTC